MDMEIFFLGTLGSKLILKHVRHILDIYLNLISTSKLDDDCFEGKTHRVAFYIAPSSKKSNMLNIIHIDWCVCSIKGESLSGATYFVSFIATHYRKCDFSFWDLKTRCWISLKSLMRKLKEKLEESLKVLELIMVESIGNHLKNTINFMVLRLKELLLNIPTWRYWKKNDNDNWKILLYVVSCKATQVLS